MTIPKIEQGFDRNVDFKKIKEGLISEYNTTIEQIGQLDESDRYYASKRRKLYNRTIYLLVAMIQLINGSRISEACYAFKDFIEKDDLTEKVVEKIAKSESIKYKKDGKKYITKARYRHLIFPHKWITLSDTTKSEIMYFSNKIEPEVLKKRVLDYLLKHHDCNTHSLRYAFINYMLYKEKKEATLVAKHVGHSSVAQLVRYTQKKEADKLFEMDI
jgi:integrase